MLETENEIIDDDSDTDFEDAVESREEDSESEQDYEFDDEDMNTGTESFYIRKDNVTKWNKKVPNKSVITRSEKLVTRLPASKKLPTRNSKNPLEVWKHFWNTSLKEKQVWTKC